MGPGTSSKKKVLVGLPDGEDEDTTVLRNVANKTPNNKSSHPDFNLQQPGCEKIRFREV